MNDDRCPYLDNPWVFVLACLACLLAGLLATAA